MSKPEIIFRVLDGNLFSCEITSLANKRLTMRGHSLDDSGLQVENDFGSNEALLLSAWAFAKSSYESVTLGDSEHQQQASKRAKKLKKTLEWLVEYADHLTDETRSGWCSACFGKYEHRKVQRPFGQPSVNLCENCGVPTIPCMAPLCANMAARGVGLISGQQFCAEHRHEISGFEKAERSIDSLNEYEALLEFDKPNFARASKFVGMTAAGVALATPLAFTVAPAIGGAFGALASGYTGAAATSWGLATLGGGSLAAGGFGMAGGALVVTGVGAALGGALGAAVCNEYVREDKSFHIELLQGGTGVPVVVCNGFLSESGKGWGSWKTIVRNRYPDSPVYRVRWGAKELKNLSIFGGAAAVPNIGVGAIKPLAQKAAKAAAKKLGPIPPALLAADLAKNPWNVAKKRSEKTGIVLADLIARSTEGPYVLIGHSLGARAMIVAAQALGVRSSVPKIESMHLLGAAIGSKSDWSGLVNSVSGMVYNYHSTNDGVLKKVYSVVSIGKKAAGLTGFSPRYDKIQNIDVSKCVNSHSSYQAEVELIGTQASEAS